jgi:hypothetical protein
MRTIPLFRVSQSDRLSSLDETRRYNNHNCRNNMANSGQCTGFFQRLPTAVHTHTHQVEKQHTTSTFTSSDVGNNNQQGTISKLHITA